MQSSHKRNHHDNPVGCRRPYRCDNMCRAGFLRLLRRIQIYMCMLLSDYTWPVTDNALLRMVEPYHKEKCTSVITSLLDIIHSVGAVKRLYCSITFWQQLNGMRKYYGEAGFHETATSPELSAIGLCQRNCTTRFVSGRESVNSHLKRNKKRLRMIVLRITAYALANVIWWIRPHLIAMCRPLTTFYAIITGTFFTERVGNIITTSRFCFHRKKWTDQHHRTKLKLKEKI